MRLIGRIQCLLARKHVRGRLVDSLEVVPGERLNTYACPRCGATHARKVRAKPEAPVLKVA